MVNKTILIGNLGKDPEVRNLESGVSVATFSIATSENFKDKNGEWQTNTEWHNVVLWRKEAEKAEKNYKKGMLIYLEGKLTHRSYDDKDGNKRYISEVVANYTRNLTKREESDQSNLPEPQKVETTNENKKPQPDDDLPF